MPVTLKQIESHFYSDYFKDLTEKEQKLLPNTVMHDLNKLEKEFDNEVMVNMHYKLHGWIEAHPWKTGSVISDWRKKFHYMCNKLRKEKHNG